MNQNPFGGRCSVPVQQGVVNLSCAFFCPATAVIAIPPAPEGNCQRAAFATTAGQHALLFSRDPPLRGRNKGRPSASHPVGLRSPPETTRISSLVRCPKAVVQPLRGDKRPSTGVLRWVNLLAPLLGRENALFPGFSAFVEAVAPCKLPDALESRECSPGWRSA